MSAGVRSDATRIKELVAQKLERANIGRVAIGSQLTIGNELAALPDILISRGSEQPFEHEHGAGVISGLEIIVTVFVRSGDDLENEIERFIQSVDNALTSDIRLGEQAIDIRLLGFSQPRVHPIGDNQGVGSFDGRYLARYQYDAGNR